MVAILKSAHCARSQQWGRGTVASPGEGAAPPGENFKILAPIFASIPNLSPNCQLIGGVYEAECRSFMFPSTTETNWDFLIYDYIGFHELLQWFN